MNAFNQFFEQFARKTANITGKPITFLIAVLVIIVWGVTGPIFHFSDTWQLVINTGTTIITFLMVFLVQSAQNRDARALQLKLDELIFKIQKADNVMMNIEDLSEPELVALTEKYKKLRRKRAVTSKRKRKKLTEEGMAEINADIVKATSQQKNVHNKREKSPTKKAALTKAA